MDQEASRETNPLLEPWTGPFEAPPFDRLKPSHFGQAFAVALAGCGIFNNPQTSGVPPAEPRDRQEQ